MDVVVVAYQSRNALERSLPAALALRPTNRVVVVDNGSDGSGGFAASLGAEVISLPTNPGFGTANNVAMVKCQDEFVLLLNPDAEPVPAGIEAGLVHLAEHPNVAAVQGVVASRSTGRPERSQGREIAPVHLLGRALGLRRLAGLRLVAAVGRRTSVADHVERAPLSPVAVESLAATALLIRRAAFEGVGGFDERYFLYGEDQDLCRRLRNAGWQLVALPDRWAIHTSGESSDGWFSREWVWWRGTMQFAAEWWDSAAWSVAVAAAAIQWVRLTVARPASARSSWSGLIGFSLAVRRARRAGPVR